MADIDHKQFLAALTAQQRLELLAKSDVAGLRHLAGHLGAIVLCAVLIVTRVPFWQAVMLIQGILLVFLFTTLHETIHGTAFRSERLNSAVAALCGFAVILPPEWFRYFHFAHHRFTHDPERDPELATPKATEWLPYLAYLSGIPEWISRVRKLISRAVVENTDDFVPAKGRSKVMREARLYLAAYAVLCAVCVIAGWYDILFVWIVPLILGGPFLRGYLLAEHSRCPHVASMFDNTRTTYTNTIMRFVAWNMPYHVEHHTYPSVPFHKLPAFHKLIREHIVHTENGYLRFNAKYFAATRDGSLTAQEND